MLSFAGVHEIPVGQFLKLVKVSKWQHIQLLLTVLYHLQTCCQCTLLIIQIINEDVKQRWPQD